MTCWTEVLGRGINVGCGPLSAPILTRWTGWIDLVPVVLRGVPGYEGCPGLRVFRDGNDLGFNETYYPDAVIVARASTCVDPNKYDCLNGACIATIVYRTPGLYTSLQACKNACGVGCSGKCISNQDWSKIESLSKQLKNRNCN